MSVQFLEARACQCHDLGEPVFGDGVLLMIVVPRRFTPCEDNIKGSQNFIVESFSEFPEECRD